MQSLGNNPYLGNELRLGFQTLGSDYWHQVHNYPTFGVGFYMGTFNNEVLGNPRATFVFMELPFARKEKSYFASTWSAGLAFHLNEYDSISNPGNMAIGSDLNAFFDLGLIYKYRVKKNFEIGGGIKIQHFSNGAIKYPNLGLNMLSAVVSLTYYPHKNETIFREDAKPKKLKKYEIIPVFSVAWKSKYEDNSDIMYINTTTSLSINKRVNYKRSVGIGFDHFYQGYLVDYYDADKNITNKDLMSYAGFLSSDLILNRFRLVAQLGFYIYRPVDFGLFFYERISMRFYPTENLFFSISIKAHAAKAEFIEWGLGYNF